MANTGYIINPKVIQIFTSGPNSGSEVSSSYNIEFDVSSSFTSSIKCTNEFFYKIYNPTECVVDTGSYCPNISLINVSVVSCSNYNYQYEITYNPYGADISSVEFSVYPNLSHSVLGEILLNNPGINTVIINISDVGVLPLNGYSPVYFRMRNLCEGPIPSSSYSNVIQANCELEGEQIYNVILHKSNISKCSNFTSSKVNPVCNFDSTFCGRLYNINSPSFSISTTLKNSDGLNNAPPSWYSDGVVSRYWNGSIFTITNIC